MAAAMSISYAQKYLLSFKTANIQFSICVGIRLI